MLDTPTQSVPPLSLTDQARDPAAFARALCGSFERFGFAIVAHHGIDAGLIDRAWAATRAFFARPTDEKLAYSAKSCGARGYIPFGIEIAGRPASGTGTVQ